MIKKRSKSLKVVGEKAPRDIQEALDRFPAIVRQKAERYKKRQAFIKKTFGPLVRKLEKLTRS